MIVRGVAGEAVSLFLGNLHRLAALTLPFVALSTVAWLALGQPTEDDAAWWLSLLADMVFFNLAFAAVAEWVLRREVPAHRILARTLARSGSISVTALLVLLGTIGGTILFVVPGILLATRWSVAIPALMAEDVRGVRALRRSGELVEGKRWTAFWLVIAPSVLIGVTPLVAARFLSPGNRAFAVSEVSYGVLAVLVYVGAAVLFQRLAAIQEDPSHAI